MLLATASGSVDPEAPVLFFLEALHLARHEDLLDPRPPAQSLDVLHVCADRLGENGRIHEPADVDRR